MALFKGLRKITLLVGDNRRVEIDTELKSDSTNPVVNSAITTAIQQINDNMNALTVRMSAIEESLVNTVTEIQTLQTNLAATNENIATTNYNLATTNDDLGAANAEIALQENKINALTEELNTLSSTITTTQNELNEIDVLTENVASLDSRVTTLEGYHTGSNEGILDDTGTNLEDLFG